MDANLFKNVKKPKTFCRYNNNSLLVNIPTVQQKRTSSLDSKIDTCNRPFLILFLVLAKTAIFVKNAVISILLKLHYLFFDFIIPHEDLFNDSNIQNKLVFQNE